MYSVLNTLSEYTYSYISKKTLLHILMLRVSKIVESFQCILKAFNFVKITLNKLQELVV